MKNIEDVLSKLNPETRRKVKIASTLEIERQPLPSIGLTKVLNGGLKYGAQHMFWGNRSSGKTAVALETIAMAQANDKVCLLVDVEGAYTKEWGAKLGIDNDKLLLISDDRTFAGVTNAVVQYIRAGVDLVVIDSISALQPGSFFEKNGDLKAFQDTNQIGQHAKDCGKMCTTFNLINETTMIILISQITTGIYNWGAVGEPMGGKKTMHMNTTAIKFTSSLTEANQIEGSVSDGNLVFNKAIGRPVDWKIDKDRGPGMGAKGAYDFYYDGDNVGIDRIGEMVHFGTLYGILEKGGAWYTVYGERLQGKAKVIEHLKANPEIKDKLESDLLARK